MACCPADGIGQDRGDEVYRIAEVLAEGGTRTPDLGGNAGTTALGAAITAAIR